MSAVLTPVTILEGVVAVIAIAGSIAFLWANLTSKLPSATVKIQNDNISALKEQNDLLKASVSELTAAITELNARVKVLETIPLSTMADSLSKIAASIEELRDIGHTNQALMQAAAAAATSTTINNN